MILKEETFCIQFNNAHKVPKPYRRRVTYLCYQLQEANGAPLTKDCLRTKVPDVRQAGLSCLLGVQEQ